MPGSADRALIALEGRLNPLVEHGVRVMKPIILEFVGGCWDGKTLRTDSPDDEEQLVAAACYDPTNRGERNDGRETNPLRTVRLNAIYWSAASRERVREKQQQSPQEARHNG